ncbi:MAG: hypothetical protein ABIJ34_01380 [archaeon]
MVNQQNYDNALETAKILAGMGDEKGSREWELFAQGAFNPKGVGVSALSVPLLFKGHQQSSLAVDLQKLYDDLSQIDQNLSTQLAVNNETSDSLNHIVFAIPLLRTKGVEEKGRILQILKESVHKERSSLQYAFWFFRSHIRREDSIHKRIMIALESHKERYYKEIAEINKLFDIYVRNMTELSTKDKGLISLESNEDALASQFMSKIEKLTEADIGNLVNEEHEISKYLMMCNKLIQTTYATVQEILKNVRYIMKSLQH